MLFRSGRVAVVCAMTDVDVTAPTTLAIAATRNRTIMAGPPSSRHSCDNVTEPTPIANLDQSFIGTSVLFGGIRGPGAVVAGRDRGCGCDDAAAGR